MNIMKQIFLGLTISIYLLSCSNKVETPCEHNEPLISDREQQESINDKNRKYNYPEIISLSAPRLELIKNSWTSEAILCSEQEEFITLRKVSELRCVAISVQEDSGSTSFQFYDFNINGEILHKSLIPKTDYYIDNRFNFRVSNDTVYYFTKKDEQDVQAYSLSNCSHIRVPSNKLNWSKINDWKHQSNYLSPNGEIEIELSDVKLIVKEHGVNKDTLINQVYDGSWSFRQAVWNKDNNKFYFDNSGAVACIWEIDLDKKVLDKIVPNH